MQTSETLDLKSLIRSIPDYPKTGIIFRDITSLIAHGAGFKQSVRQLVDPYRGQGIDKIVGIEARGFIFGGAMAEQLGVGFVPIRKQGKLPGEVIGQDYALEYGTDRIELHADAIKAGEKILLVDDLIATGGTAAAAVDLLRRAGADIVGSAFVIDLPELGGTDALRAKGVDVHCLIAFEGL
ncbi:adenine phosphoribosyltransferase [Cohaesibacter celericrescens]|uniref:Adenine phosphoribosyltransferase n=1 Tax=Cohaesibacter celericrescens TaxID=2067669 RepID=A0A2N5XXE1_9HYPH|nr:adenine phosphoribosyltransferase [Cohaesibacter celericrescens]PLW79162.1 adenine phosphoribosyltransferase [Cohaesibacter celericrescens]